MSSIKQLKWLRRRRKSVIACAARPRKSAAMPKKPYQMPRRLNVKLLSAPKMKLSRSSRRLKTLCKRLKRRLDKPLSVMLRDKVSKTMLRSKQPRWLVWQLRRQHVWPQRPHAKLKKMPNAPVKNKLVCRSLNKKKTASLRLLTALTLRSSKKRVIKHFSCISQRVNPTSLMRISPKLKRETKRQRIMCTSEQKRSKAQMEDLLTSKIWCFQMVPQPLMLTKEAWAIVTCSQR